MLNMPNRLLSQFLSTNGDGTGDINIVGDYSSAAETFEVENPPMVAATVIERIVVYIRDTGAFSAEKYGARASLPVGLNLDVRSADDNVLFSLTPDAIRNNGEWGKYCFEVDTKKWGGGDQILVARWSFVKFTEAAEGIVLNNGERFVLTVNDDFQSLVTHTILAQGYTSIVY
jgi:hypothetical protein